MTVFDLIFGWPIMLGTLGYYAIILVCLVVAFRRLRKNWYDPAGLVAVGILLLFPINIYWYAKSYSEAADAREREVASWKRVAVPEPLPDLMVIGSGTENTDYILALAETGLFQVYVSDRPRSRLYKAEVANRSDCAARRRVKALYTAATAFRRCAELIEIDKLPTDGLFLYTSADVARSVTPGSLYRSREEPQPYLTNWAIELGWRHGVDEDLVAYEELLRKAELSFHPLYGVRFQWQRPALKYNTSDRGPEPDRFLFAALGIDPTAIRPPGMATPDEIADVARNLQQSKDPALAHQLFTLAAAYPSRIPELADVIISEMSRPQRSDHDVRGLYDCDGIAGLAKYRADMARGCESNAERKKRCSPRDSSEFWLERCVSDGWPLWHASDGPASRILVGELRSTIQTDVSPNSASKWRVVEIIVPPDRGMFDVVIWDESFFHFSGATSCLRKVTLVGDQGVAAWGLPSEKVQFLRNPFGGNLRTYTSNDENKAKFLGMLPGIIGATPDAVAIGVSQSTIDMGTLIPRSQSKGRCPSGPIAPPLTFRADGMADLDPDELLVVPATIPTRHRPE